MVTTTIATNSKNDLHLTASGNLAIRSGIDAVMQNCETAVKAQRGEMMFAMDQGIPYMDIVFNNTSIPKFRAAVISAILAVEGVLSVHGFEATISGDTVRYIAEIETVYGIGNLNGGL